jgi:hypothetical protein
MAQAVSRRPLTAEARVSRGGICGGQSDTGTGSSTFPCRYHSTVPLHTHILPGGLTIGLLMATVQRHGFTPSSWTTLPKITPNYFCMLRLYFCLHSCLLFLFFSSRPHILMALIGSRSRRAIWPLCGIVEYLRSGPDEPYRAAEPRSLVRVSVSSAWPHCERRSVTQ